MLDMLMGAPPAGGSPLGEDTEPMRPDQVTLGWVAGFFDGEGCVYIHTATKQHRLPQFCLTISLVNTDRRALEIVRALFPESTVRRCTRVKQNKQQYEWRIHGAVAQKFCKMILGYSVIKREQLELAIAFFDLPWRRLSLRHSWKERTQDQALVDLDYSRRIAEMKRVSVG